MLKTSMLLIILVLFGTYVKKVKQYKGVCSETVSPVSQTEEEGLSRPVLLGWDSL